MSNFKILPNRQTALCQWEDVCIAYSHAVAVSNSIKHFLVTTEIFYWISHCHGVALRQTSSNWLSGLMVSGTWAASLPVTVICWRWVCWWLAASASYLVLSSPILLVVSSLWLAFIIYYSNYMLCTALLLLLLLATTFYY